MDFNRHELIANAYWGFKFELFEFYWDIFNELLRKYETESTYIPLKKIFEETKAVTIIKNSSSFDKKTVEKFKKIYQEKYEKKSEIVVSKKTELTERTNVHSSHNECSVEKPHISTSSIKVTSESNIVSTKEHTVKTVSSYNTRITNKYYENTIPDIRNKSIVCSKNSYAKPNNSPSNKALKSNTRITCHNRSISSNASKVLRNNTCRSRH